MNQCHAILRKWLGQALLLATALHLPASERNFAARYERLFSEGRAAWAATPTNSTAGWRFARAAFDWAEFATNQTQKISIARPGIAAARASISLQPRTAAAHYYLALNLGQLADATRSLGGLKLVSEMERELKTACELEAAFDYAGPDRSLGMLYRDAPGWPVSVGSRAKARQHLERACVLNSAYPDNQLSLLEGLLKWGQQKNVLEKLKPTAALLATARQQLTGEEWAASWADWDRRWRDLQTKAGAEPIRPAASPKGAR